MLRILALIAALLAPAPFLLAHPEGTTSAPPSEADAELFFSQRLPAPNAWVAAPFTAVGDVAVTAWTTEPGQAPGARVHSGSLLASIEGREDGLMYGGGSGVGSHLFEVNAHGLRATCCEAPEALAGTSEPGEGEIQVFLLDGETLWITFVGANVDVEQPFEIALAFEGGQLAPQVYREGTDVTLIDLVDAAHANGLNARFGGRTIVGTNGPVALSFTPEQNGFLALNYHGDESEPMDLRVSVGDETPVEGPAPSGGGLFYALGTASYEVHFDLGETKLPTLPQQNAGWGSAMLLYADIDVPGAGMQAYEWEG